LFFVKIIEVIQCHLKDSYIIKKFCCAIHTQYRSNPLSFVHYNALIGHFYLCVPLNTNMHMLLYVLISVSSELMVALIISQCI